MPQPRFDTMSERLLCAGIAPRHVRRYVGELRDHFDDIVREETAGGIARSAAEASAASRLGSEDDLADVMLARPDLRSITSRFPWAVFGLGSGAMVIAAPAVGLVIEMAVLDLVSAQMHAFGWKPGSGLLRSFILGVEVWNTFVVDVAPLGVAALLYVIGTRQRAPFAWIVAGMAIACFLGGFQYLSWYDTGTRGELSFASGLLPPFPHFAAGLAHAAANLVLMGSVAWWLTVRRRVSS